MIVMHKGVYEYLTGAGLLQVQEKCHVKTCHDIHKRKRLLFGEAFCRCRVDSFASFCRCRIVSGEACLVPHRRP